MKRIDIKVGYACNNNCLHCVVGDRRGASGDLSTREVFDLLDRFSGEMEEVILTGGEVSIRKDMCDIVRRAKSLGYASVVIQTNGRMFAYKRLAEDIKDAGADVVSVAILSDNPDIHNALTRSDSFAQTALGISNLKAAGVNVVTNTVTAKMNAPTIPSLVKMLNALEVKLVQFAFPHALGSAGVNAKIILPKKTEVAPYIKRAIGWGADRSMDFLVEAVPYCLMRGYERFIAERYAPDTALWIDDGLIDDYGAYRVSCGKAKGPECAACAMFGVCEGPWVEYVEMYGWGEFKPIKKGVDPGAAGRSGFRVAGYF